MLLNLIAFSLLGAAAQGINTTCGSDPAKVPDCDHPDLGSCGNACCKLEIHITGLQGAHPVRPVDVQIILNETLAHGGPDGRYSFSPMAGGSVGFTDLRPFNISGVSFLGQTHHLTAKRTYTDTQNWLIGPGTYKGRDGTVIKAFSTSEIGGAYGDAGQNYKNLVLPAYRSLMRSATARLYAWHFNIVHPDGSCPAPATAA